ncbi:hypothetical protein [Edaphobacter aggregans]|uniref:hypothetical protein n=1 Tax=Edaphobacter aggregans TaxID=570835 RepID=UPI0012FA63AC|nr:hypothetical protein [Edaphobacter aggregans]
MPSADGTKDAILWVVSTKEWNEAHMDRPAVLHATMRGTLRVSCTTVNRRANGIVPI